MGWLYMQSLGGIREPARLSRRSVHLRAAETMRVSACCARRWSRCGRTTPRSRCQILAGRAPRGRPRSSASSASIRATREGYVFGYKDHDRAPWGRARPSARRRSWTCSRRPTHAYAVAWRERCRAAVTTRGEEPPSAQRVDAGVRGADHLHRRVGARAAGGGDRPAPAARGALPTAGRLRPLSDRQSRPVAASRSSRRPEDPAPRRRARRFAPGPFLHAGPQRGRGSAGRR